MAARSGWPARRPGNLEIRTIFSRPPGHGYDQPKPVEVRVNPDGIDIVSYPGPDPSIRIEALSGDKIVARRYRNRRIGEFLKELDLTEGRCTGIPIIRAAMARNGSPSISTYHSFRFFQYQILPGRAMSSSRNLSSNLSIVGFLREKARCRSSWHSEGRRFDPDILHILKPFTTKSCDWLFLCADSGGVVAVLPRCYPVEKNGVFPPGCQTSAWGLFRCPRPAGLVRSDAPRRTPACSLIDEHARPWVG